MYHRIRFAAILGSRNRLSGGSCLVLKTQPPRSKFHGSFATVPFVSIAFRIFSDPLYRWVGWYFPQRRTLLLQWGRVSVHVGTELVRDLQDLLLGGLDSVELRYPIPFTPSTGYQP